MLSSQGYAMIVGGHFDSTGLQPTSNEYILTFLNSQDAFSNLKNKPVKKRKIKYANSYQTLYFILRNQPLLKALKKHAKEL